MRRVNVHLDDELDEDLSSEARRTGRTRASLLREAARAFLGQRSAEGDAWEDFTGAVTHVAALDEADDDLIYR